MRAIGEAVHGRLARRDTSVAVIVPARNEETVIGGLAAALSTARDAALLDEVVIVDGGSLDATVGRARATGVEVVEAGRILPETGEVLGKGDSMWRALATVDSDIVCFMDADLDGDPVARVERLVAPLLAEPGLAFVKGRFEASATSTARGRVTTLTARPLLDRFFPELSAFNAPLSGQIAGRSDDLRRLPFATGYGVDVGLLIDAHRTLGMGALAEVDIGPRGDRRRPLEELGPTAMQVSDVIWRRSEQAGRLLPRVPGHDPPSEVRTVDRPPHARVM